jgi:hypothetical protein
MVLVLKVISCFALLINLPHFLLVFPHEIRQGFQALSHIMNPPGDQAMAACVLAVFPEQAAVDLQFPLEVINHSGHHNLFHRGSQRVDVFGLVFHGFGF